MKFAFWPALSHNWKNESGKIVNVQRSYSLFIRSWYEFQVWRLLDSLKKTYFLKWMFRRLMSRLLMSWRCCFFFNFWCFNICVTLAEKIMKCIFPGSPEPKTQSCNTSHSWSRSATLELWTGGALEHGAASGNTGRQVGLECGAKAVA